MTGVRLYGVAAAQGSAAPRLRDAEAVVHRDLAAVVAADAPAPEAGTPVDLADYRRVVESVFRERAVLPAPPGTVFRSRDVVAQWLELHYFTLLDALAFVEDRAVARVSVSRRDPAAGGGAGPADGAPPLPHEALRALRRQAVAGLAVGTDGAGHVVAMSYLVEQAQWDAFLALVAHEGARLADARFAVTGPWPPYDFVRMQFTS